MRNKKSLIDMLQEQKTHLYFTLYILLLLGISLIEGPTTLQQLGLDSLKLDLREQQAISQVQH